ncbi:MAG: HPP family protein [Deltaproteobacteria bacterium]|nr:HPP family protein [Deltaproteobacteria bacterium]
MPKSPLAHPRNLIGGYVISSIVGVLAQKLFVDPVIAAPLAVATATLCMHLTRTLHPPGGATALIAVIGGRKIHELGFLYVLIPSLAGAIILLVVALLVNNLSPHRSYPEYWV